MSEGTLGPVYRMIERSPEFILIELDRLKVLAWRRSEGSRCHTIGSLNKALIGQNMQ